MEQVIAMILLAGFILLVMFLDRRFDLGLANDKSITGSFSYCGTTGEESSKCCQQVDAAELAELKARVQVLEKIVTQPGYQLEQEINRL